MFVSVTRLRVRSVINLPAFLWQTFLAQRQTVRASGFAGGKLLIDAHRTFWTITVWETEKLMKAFRGSGAHARVMPKLVQWCDEASYAHWIPANGEIPDWPEAYEHLVNEGHLSHVAHPSADHENRRFPKPRLQPLIGQNLSPRK
ncbi:MAG TPA: DUF3291 domain-containing protein [Candidatus Sulfotelmatobacter sp.]